MSGSVIGALLALTTAVFWGALPIAMKQALEVMSPVTIVWYRFFTAFVGLTLWLMWRKQFPKVSNFDSRSCFYLLLAALGLAGNFVLYNNALQYLGPPVVQVIIQLAPVILLVSSAWIFKEKLSIYQVIGVIGLLLGLLLFFNERLQELFTSFTGYTVGVLFAVAAALVWVVYALAQKGLLQRFGSAQILFIVYGLCTLILTPFAEFGQLLLMDPRQMSMLLFCCINTLIGYGAFAEALARWQAAQVSALITLTPLFTIFFVDISSSLWPTIIAPVSLNFWAYLGAIVVVSSAVFCAAGHKLIRLRRSKNEVYR